MTTATQKPSIPWKRAKTIKIPIPKTGTKFRQFPDFPARPCEVTASFDFLPIDGGKAWRWRVNLDTPLFHTDDPECHKHRAAVSSGQAIEAAVAEILRMLRSEVDIRRNTKQTEIASACAQAVWHVEQFLAYIRNTGKFLTKAIVPGGTKPREQFDDEVEAIQKQKPSTAIAVRSAAVVTVEATQVTTSERRKLTADFEKAWMALGRNFLVLGETVLRAEDGAMSVDDLIAVTGLTAARSTAYAARKATKLWRVFQPFAESAGIVLDCESQFRDFPADLDLTPPEARKIVKLIEKEIEPDKREQRRPTREQLKPIIAATVGLRGIGPEKRKAQPATESHDQEPDEPKQAAAESHGPGMFGRPMQVHGDPSAWREALQSPAEPFDKPLFPHCDTIDQACCVLRSWIGSLTRQFPADDLSDLDEELYRQCNILRDIYRPAIQEAATAAAKKSGRRAR